VVVVAVVVDTTLLLEMVVLVVVVQVVDTYNLDQPQELLILAAVAVEKVAAVLVPMVVLELCYFDTQAV
jgi:hypothetical protein